MTRQLLPPHRTPLQAALADTGVPAIVPVTLRHTADATRCPAALLPWLAWARSVDGWDEAVTEPARRALIRQSFAIHQRKGTAGAVRRAMAALGVTVDFTEWQRTPGATPYTFSLVAWVNDNPADESAVLTPQLYQRLQRIVDQTRNERSHAAFRIGARFDMPHWELASAQQAAAIGRWDSTTQAVQPTPAGQPLRLANTQHTRAAARSSATPAAVQPAASLNLMRLANAARPLSIIRVAMEAQ